MLPSGKTVTRSPASRARVIASTVAGRARIRSRSMNSVPFCRESGPSSGQSPMSLLASIRQGTAAATSGMSSQETWLATIRRPPAGPGLPCTVSRMPKAPTRAVAQARTRVRRGRAGSSRTGWKPRIPSRIRVAAAVSRSTARTRLARSPSWPAQASGVQGEVGSQTLMRPGRARGSA
ncbi:hypothetical protein ACS04_24435 [Streptomyces roseus]|uniref:Uncharacterized protein n=1 Tax=Streptomyces roseus TaxID=66430 RepID=A0A0J6XMC0_9ACTN|nr:hypothetical protein ACS04_24435 [Streptomyces roseus]